MFRRKQSGKRVVVAVLKFQPRSRGLANAGHAELSPEPCGTWEGYATLSNNTLCSPCRISIRDTSSDKRTRWPGLMWSVMQQSAGQGPHHNVGYAPLTDSRDESAMALECLVKDGCRLPRRKPGGGLTEPMQSNIETGTSASITSP